MHRKFAIVALAALVVGCAENHPSVPYPYTELALEEGMEISATNKNGWVKMEWIGPLKRRYTWNGRDSEEITLWPRRERWLGQLGAYHPAGRLFFNFWSGPRLVVADSLLDFTSKEELDQFLYQGSAIFDWVYNDEGWVVGFFEEDGRGDQVNVSVFRITVNGKAPGGIDGSRPELIQIKRNNAT
jgi:hypothetical protein